jgi:hypothetical protein
MQRHLARLGAGAAFGGAAALLVGTLLHPADADPNDAAAAFAEYAADSHWVASHLAQFVGLALLGAALVALAAAAGRGRAAAWARIAVAGAAASVAVAAALQAVDGVALRVAVERWAAAAGDARARAFEAAFAVRQIEVGLASLVSLLFGLTLLALGVAMRLGRRLPGWLAWLGLAGGLGLLAAGVAQAYTGFSAVAMALSMSASAVLLVWAVAAGVVMWRLPRGAIAGRAGARAGAAALTSASRPRARPASRAPR